MIKKMIILIVMGLTLSSCQLFTEAIKDNINVIGTKTTSASKILENYVSPYDATIIKYIKEAGYRNNW